MLAAGLVAAPAAAAGTFAVSQCAAWNGTSWTPRTMQGGAWSASGGYLSSSCGAPGGGITLTTPNLRLAATRSASVSLAVPASLPGTSIRSFALDWTAAAQAPSVDPAYASIWGGSTVLLRARAGVATAPGSADRLVPPSGTRQIAFALWCSPLSGPGFCNWSRPPIDIRGLTLDLDEASPPAVTASGGLLDGALQHGRTTLALYASDADSGVRSVQARLAGVKVGSVDLAAACIDDRLPPCPPTVARTLDVDTKPVPDGTARLQLRVVDAAGNSTDVDAGPVTVENDAVAAPSPPDIGPGTPTPPPPGHDGEAFPPNPLAGHGHAPNGRGATGDARIVARLESRDRRGRRLTVAARRRVRVAGQLDARDGTPIGHAVLTLVTRIPGHRWHVAGLVSTRADGHFAEPLRAGPSRFVAVVYHAFADRRRGRWSRRLTLRVRARIALTAVVTRTGRRLAGRAAGPIPPRGVLVTIERRLAGRWLGRRRLRTDADGRFRCPAPSGPATLRAAVPAQDGYPYARGVSRIVRLP